MPERWKKEEAGWESCIQGMKAGNEGQEDRGVLMSPQILTQPPPSGTVGSVDQRCHLWETGHPEGLDWVG